MTTLLAPHFWLKQARADLKAASDNADHFRDCHRRYWLQQAYEKAIKAFLVSQIPDEPPEVLLIVRDTVLRSHCPLSSIPDTEESMEELRERLVRKYPKAWQRGLRIIKLLRRSGEQFVRSRSAHPVLRKIDETAPSIAANVPSYRYPFTHLGQAVAPADWSGWDDYQGPERLVRDAITELTDEVGRAIGLARRNRVHS